MWQSLFNKLFSSRDSVLSGDGATVAGILLVAAALDQSPPTSEQEALTRLRTILAGTKPLASVETLFHAIIK